VELLGLLVVNSPETYVTRDAVHQLPSWSGMTLESVGKQAARIADGLAIIEFKQKTNGWRLPPALHQGLPRPVVTAATTLLAGQNWHRWERFGAVPQKELADWMIGITDATVSMMLGEAKKGYDQVRGAYSATGNADLLAIANVFSTRIGQRLTVPHLPIPARDLKNSSPFEIAIESRRLAAYATRSNSGSWVKFQRKLEYILSLVADGGDFTTRAIVLNALAILYRRTGNLEKALRHIKEAVPLAVLNGDVFFIQNVMFNLANILSELARNNPEVDPWNTHVALLEAEIKLRQRAGMGNDSAQTELLLAYLCMENANLEGALHYLKCSDAIIKINKSVSDRALYHRIMGLYYAKQISVDTDNRILAHQELTRSHGLFTKVGNIASGAVVFTEMAHL
jgi:tetratricopeptide (TPR) repeat protein